MRITQRFLFLCCLMLVQTLTLQAQNATRNIDYFLGAATKYSPVLKDYKNQQQSIKIDSLLILAAAKPQVTASSAGMYAPIIKGYGYDEVLSNGQSLEALLNVNYDLSNKRKSKTNFKALNCRAIRYNMQAHFRFSI